MDNFSFEESFTLYPNDISVGNKIFGRKIGNPSSSRLKNPDVSSGGVSFSDDNSDNRVDRVDITDANSDDRANIANDDEFADFIENDYDAKNDGSDVFSMSCAEFEKVDGGLRIVNESHCEVRNDGVTLSGAVAGMSPAMINDIPDAILRASLRASRESDASILRSGLGAGVSSADKAAFTERLNEIDY